MRGERHIRLCCSNDAVDKRSSIDARAMRCAVDWLVCPRLRRTMRTSWRAGNQGVDRRSPTVTADPNDGRSYGSGRALATGKRVRIGHGSGRTETALPRASAGPCREVLDREALGTKVNVFVRDMRGQAGHQSANESPPPDSIPLHARLAFVSGNTSHAFDR